MPNKKQKRKTTATHKKDQTFRIAFIILGSFLVALTAIIFLSPQQNSLCANTISCAKDLSDKPQTDNQGIFFGQKVQAPNIPDTPTFAIENAKQAVLGDTTASKHIYVDLTNQRLIAYEGNSVFMDTRISSGKWNPTPTGDFHIWVWLRATRMTGGSGADYYNLPNVPYTMFFYNNQVLKSWGYSLHGTYWHNNFGHPMSHGCVNMRTADAQRIYEWTDPNLGTWTTYATSDSQSPTITIYGTTPQS